MNEFKFDKDLIIFDVETSGVTKDSSVIQLGAIRFSKNGKALVNETFNQYITPYLSEWDTNAQAIHGLTKEFLQEKGVPVHECLKNFGKWAYQTTSRDAYLAQWSCGFDTTMLQRAYEYCGMRYPFLYRAWDIASIVRFYLATEGFNTSKGLGDCARLIGLNTSNFKAHDALADAMVTALTLEKLIDSIVQKDGSIK